MCRREPRHADVTATVLRPPWFLRRLGAASAGLSLAAGLLRLQCGSRTQREPTPAKRRTSTASSSSSLGGHAAPRPVGLQARRPAEIRGDFKPIKTNVPGIGLTDLLPHTAEGHRQARHPAQPDARRLRPRPRLPRHDDRQHPRPRRLQLDARTTTSTRASARWSPA